MRAYATVWRGPILQTLGGDVPMTPGKMNVEQDAVEPTGIEYQPPEITHLGNMRDVTQAVLNQGTGDAAFVSAPGGFSLDCCFAAS